MRDDLEPASAFDDMAEHERTYAKFVRGAQIAAATTPLLLAFVLYWTT